MEKRIITPKEREEISRFVNERLGGFIEVKNIFIECKADNEIKVIVFTKEINPLIELKAVEVEDQVKEKYNIPAHISTFSMASMFADAVAVA